MDSGQRLKQKRRNGESGSRGNGAKAEEEDSRQRTEDSGHRTEGGGRKAVDPPTLKLRRGKQRADC
ncbi:MAG: hypothetical protein JRJ23_07860 [Deltaproteobacteria bacterium]|nr:hypothetical protein [Deltaproteobacteria bacterium]